MSLGLRLVGEFSVIVLGVLVALGLERTHGSYRLLVELFNMRETDYKRFLNVLRKLDCHVAFQPFRVIKTPSAATAERRAPTLED